MIALASFVLTAFPTLCPQLRSQPVLHPRTYVSPSGDWTVTVDPTKIHGQGPGEYEAAHAGERAWSQRLPFTLYEAVVDDAGYVAGYAYTNGMSDPREVGEFVVVLVSPAGKVIAVHSTPREPSPDMHSAPDPVAAGLLLDRGAKRFIVRLDTRRSREEYVWLAFDMRNGKRLDEFIPAQKAKADSMPRRPSSMPRVQLKVHHSTSRSVHVCDSIASPRFMILSSTCSICTASLWRP